MGPLGLEPQVMVSFPRGGFVLSRHGLPMLMFDMAWPAIVWAGRKIGRAMTLQL
uniref:Uncharacterized protein n=1 Tax=Nelumbo nucifera TaxID=4432 RepID=A0A822YYC3_NELNU|nr:TPA_asm: hypothetical protein HUJ06_008303 [Nelumbo nucifera]